MVVIPFSKVSDKAWQTSAGFEVIINAALERFIASLGCELICEVAARKIARAFGAAWLSASYDELIALDGFGENMAQSFLEFVRVNESKVRELLTFIQPVLPRCRHTLLFHLK